MIIYTSTYTYAVIWKYDLTKEWSANKYQGKIAKYYKHVPKYLQNHTPSKNRSSIQNRQIIQLHYQTLSAVFEKTRLEKAHTTYSSLYIPVHVYIYTIPS